MSSFINVVVAQPRIEVDPVELDFDIVEIEDAADLVITISNEGNEDLVVERIAVEGECFEIENEGDFVLTEEETVGITVIFEPDDIREYEGRVLITSNDPEHGEVAVELYGVGWLWEGPPLPVDLNFGEVFVGERAELTFTIGNEGRHDLVIAGIFIEGDGFGVEWEGDEVIIEPGGALETIVYFEPEEEREYEGILIIITNDPDNEEVWIELSGIGVPVEPEIRVEPELLDFGQVEVGQFGVCDLTIHNNGRGTLTVEDIDIDEEAFELNWDMNLEFDWEFRFYDEFMSILVIEAFIQDELLVEGDWVGVFTPGGICAGRTMVSDDGFPLGIEACGDDPGTQRIDGFRNVEELTFRIWNTEPASEYIADPVVGPEYVYRNNGFLVTDLEAAQLLRHSNNRIESGNQLDIEVTFTPEEYSVYEGTLTVFSNDPHHGELDVGLWGFGGRALIVSLREGWNMISINIIPHRMGEGRGPNIRLMMEQLRINEENHHVILMKDDDGRFYAPQFDFNNIPYWNLREGYQVKVDEDVEAVWVGETESAQGNIFIEEGWNMIAYLPTYELDASAPDFYVLSPVIDHVLIAKDNEGRFMAPEYDFSNMPPWRETQGYQVKVDEDVILNYPEEEEIVNRQSLIVNRQWIVPVRTSENMSVLVTLVKDVKAAEGDQIAAFNPTGRLVGIGAIDVDGRCGLAVWGGDPSTDVIDGLQKGEVFELRLWDAEREVEVELFAGTVHHGNALVYEPNGFTALDVAAETAIPENFYLSQNYPNPFNAVTRLTYGLPVDSHVNIKVYDVAGRLVETLIDKKQSAGHHLALWDARRATAGVYIVNLEAGNESKIIKLVCLK